MLVVFGSGYGFIEVAGGVAAYALSSTRVYWGSNGTDGYSIVSKRRSDLSDLRINFASSSGSGLRLDNLDVDDTNLYWHEVQTSSGGPIYKMPVGGGSATPLTSFLTMGSPLLSDGQYLFWTDYNAIYRLAVNVSSTPGNIWITGVEVTQGIQTYTDDNPGASNQIPLVGNKLTVVRVYVRSIEDSAGPWNDVTATLTVSGGGGVYTPFNRYTITVSRSGSNRRTLDDSFAFVLNPSATAPGQRDLQIQIRSRSGRPENYLPDNEFTQRVTFGPARELQIYGFTYANTNNGSTCSGASPNGVTPPFRAFEPHRQFMENVYPVSTLNIVPLPGNPQRSFDNSDCQAYLRAHGWLGGMVSALPDANVRADLLMPEDTMAGWCCNGTSGHLVSRSGNSTNYMGIGHTLSQEQGHATFPCPMCNCHTFDPCYGYPYNYDTIGPQMGVKIRPGLEVRPGLNPDNSNATGDFMSYSPLDRLPSWVSPFTYCSLLGVLSSNATVCPPGVQSRAPARPPVSSRANAPRQLNPRGLTTFLYVSGWVDATNQVRFAPFEIVNSNQDLTTPSSGKRYQLALLDASEGTLASYWFNPSEDHHPNDPSPPTLFSAYLPFDPTTTQIVLRDYNADAQVIASRRRSVHAPQVTFTTSFAGLTMKGKQTVGWTASDKDGDALSFGIDYSRDGGKTWIRINRELTGTSTVVNFNALPGSTSALLRVVATDGVNTSSAASDGTFTVAFKRPQVNLQGVKSGAVYNVNTRFLLQATAFDWGAGAITDPAAFTWQDSIDGDLGTGQWLVPALSPGTHTITLTVKGTEGRLRRRSLTVTISKP